MVGNLTAAGNRSGAAPINQRPTVIKLKSDAGSS